MYIFIITLLGFLIRIININKSEGLWNDEYVSWMVASTPFNDGFWTAVIKQCHMPLYYLYLKPFNHCSDLILRFTSVVPSILAIPVMYLIGKEYSKKCGYFCAIITAVLPFLVYYSQEVRFYSLVFLLSAVILLFSIRFIKQSNKINTFALILSSITLILTHHLGIIFVILLSIYVNYKKKFISKKHLFIIIPFFIVLIPIFINIASQLPSSQWWGRFSYSNILFLFSDYFSPILTNNINAPTVFFYTENAYMNILLVVPTLIAVLGISASIKNTRGLFCIAIGNILVLSILASTGIIVFISKYVIEILPILILMLGLSFNKNIVFKFLLIFFIAIQVFSLITPFYPTYKYRGEGHKIVGDIINEKKPDKILFTYYEPDRFYKYINNNYESYYISKINRQEYKDNPMAAIDGIKTGDKISFIFLDSVSFIPNNIPNEMLNKIPEMFVTFSDIRNTLIEEINSNYTNFDVENDGNWTVITAIKK